MYNSATILNYSHIDPPLWNIKKWIGIIGAAIGCCMLILLIPTWAWANMWGWADPNIFDPNFFPNVWATFITVPLYNSANENFRYMINNIQNTDTSMLTADWNNLLAGGGDLYNFCVNISNVVIKPLAGTLLSIVCLMQLIKISSKADSQGTLPVVKEVFFLIIFISIFCFVISHAFEICGAIYQAVVFICRQIQIQGSQFTINCDFISLLDGKDLAASQDDFYKVDTGKLLPITITLVIGQLVALLAGIIGTVMIIARSLQLYIYAAFSPIPMSLIGFDETKSWGVGYFKSFSAIALAGALLLIIVFAFPFLITGIFGGNVDHILYINDLWGNNQEGVGKITDGMLYAGKAIACSVVFILAVIKSGQWSKEILGG